MRPRSLAHEKIAQARVRKAASGLSQILDPESGAGNVARNVLVNYKPDLAHIQSLALQIHRI